MPKPTVKLIRIAVPETELELLFDVDCVKNKPVDKQDAYNIKLKCMDKRYPFIISLDYYNGTDGYKKWTLQITYRGDVFYHRNVNQYLDTGARVRDLAVQVKPILWEEPAIAISSHLHDLADKKLRRRLQRWKGTSHATMSWDKVLNHKLETENDN